MSFQVGNRFGLLTVIELQKFGYALCRCDCGNEKVVLRSNLTNGLTKSCGCLARGHKPIPILPGTRFGKLTVISCEGSNALCRCDCGNEKTVTKTVLTHGYTKSCGCNPKEPKAVPIPPGTRFGKLTVISSEGTDVLCQCDCGNKSTFNKYSLIYGKTKSCGCLGKGPKSAPIAPGTRFGKLTVISSDGNDILCRCDCGNEKTIVRSNLLDGHTKSCGCLGRGPKAVPIALGTRFGRLTVISSEGRKVLCQCDCGNKTTVSKYSLANGNTKSCGCLRRKVEV